MTYDVVIAGGGPAGLAAALNLGRARRSVLLTDGPVARNAAATHVHGFLTRDGTPPAEMRRLGREQLKAYPKVEVREEPIEAIEGEAGAFVVRLASGTVTARRILLCTGMVDVLPDLEGFKELWGVSIFQCPYCHGWEVQDRRFGYLATSPESLTFPLLLREWTSEVTTFTGGAFEVPREVRESYAAAKVKLEERRVARLVAEDGHLAAVELEDGEAVACEVLFAHPAQRQVDLVASLGLALDPKGYVEFNPMSGETSVRGIYAGGDLVTFKQSATLAAASGAAAAGGLNHDLAAELATSGLL